MLSTCAVCYAPFCGGFATLPQNSTPQTAQVTTALNEMIILNWALYIGWLVAAGYTSFQFIVNTNLIRYRSIFLLVPITSIIIFSIVFVLNRGSSVAQLSESRELWSIWFQWYFFLAIGGIINLVGSVILVVVALWKKQDRKILIFNTALLIVTSLSIYHVLPNMPDA